MKAKKIIPLVIITLMVLGITSISIFSFYARENNNELKQTTSTDVTKKENLEQDSKEEQKEESEEDKIVSNEKLDTDINDNQKQDSNQNVDTTQKTDNSNSTSNSSANNNSVNNNASNNNSEPKTNTTPKVTEQPKPLTEWEKLGISEYDYYNSPREGQSDMTLDFAVSKYGNSNNAYNACMDAGSNYTGLKDYRFRCYEIYSYSGNILGYHIKYFELQS